MVNQWRVMWKEDWRGQDEAVQAIEHASMASIMRPQSLTP